MLFWKDNRALSAVLLVQQNNITWFIAIWIIFQFFYSFNFTEISVLIILSCIAFLTIMIIRWSSSSNRAFIDAQYCFHLHLEWLSSPKPLKWNNETWYVAPSQDHRMFLSWNYRHNSGPNHDNPSHPCNISAAQRRFFGGADKNVTFDKSS